MGITNKTKPEKIKRLIISQITKHNIKRLPSDSNLLKSGKAIFLIIKSNIFDYKCIGYTYTLIFKHRFNCLLQLRVHENVLEWNYIQLQLNNLFLKLDWI